jgi:hypothetical protein
LFGIDGEQDRSPLLLEYQNWPVVVNGTTCCVDEKLDTITRMQSVPADPVAAIFTRDVLDRLAALNSPTPQQSMRLRVLTTRGPLPDGAHRDLLTTVQHDRALRAAWDAYLTAAFACELFEPPHGADLQQRLTGTDDDNFRSAMAECMACWFIAGKLGLKVTPRPAGAAGKIPDLCIERDDGNITVEVKAPYRAPLAPSYVGFVRDDSHVLAATVDEANKQFAKGSRNLLFIAPSLQQPFLERRDMIKAFFGDHKIVVPLALGRPGAEPGPWRTEFVPEGKLLKPWDAGKPRFTRVSAVICVREGYRDSEAYRQFGATPVLPQTIHVEHEWYVVHNPHCPCPVPQDIWGSCPQLIRVGDAMRWTDNEPFF